MSNNHNNFEINRENNKNRPYNFDKNVYNNNIFNHYNNTEQNENNEYISPLKRSYDFSVKQKKSKLFQSENLTINKVSPSHILYKPRIYDDGGYSNNFYEVNRNDYSGKNNKNDYEGYNNDIVENNIYQRYPTLGNIEINDNKYSNIYGFKKTNEKSYKRYLKNPYYKGENIDDGYKHYNPEENNFSGSNYGSYIYNYYLNAPMRSDKIENWRFPPLYYYRPKYK